MQRDCAQRELKKRQSIVSTLLNVEKGGTTSTPHPHSHAYTPHTHIYPWHHGLLPHGSTEHLVSGLDCLCFLPAHLVEAIDRSAVIARDGASVPLPRTPSKWRCVSRTVVKCRHSSQPQHPNQAHAYPQHRVERLFPQNQLLQTPSLRLTDNICPIIIIK